MCDFELADQVQAEPMQDGERLQIAHRVPQHDGFCQTVERVLGRSDDSDVARIV